MWHVADSNHRPALSKCISQTSPSKALSSHRLLHPTDAISCAHICYTTKRIKRHQPGRSAVDRVTRWLTQFPLASLAFAVLGHHPLYTHLYRSVIHIVSLKLVHLYRSTKHTDADPHCPAGDQQRRRRIRARSRGKDIAVLPRR